MARLWQSGFELNSTTLEVEFTTNSAPVSIVTTNPRSGTYHGRVTGGTGFWRQVLFTSNQSTIGYISVAVCIHSAVNATSQLVRFSTTANGIQGCISLKTDNTLVLQKADGTQIGSASAALSLDTWYIIELKNDATLGATGALEGRLNGAVFASGSNSDTGAWARVLVGNITGTQTTNDVYFDDWKANDNSGSVETGYPGAGKIIHLKPNAAGDSNGFLVQTGGTAGSSNNYTRVNETTPDDATTYNGAALLNAEDLFNFSASGIGSNDLVKTVLVGGRFADLVAADATASIKLEIMKTSGGTKTQSAAIIPNQTTWFTNAPAAPRNYPLITYTDPDGAAWTQTTLDSLQAGYTQNATGAQTIAVSTIFVSVDYLPTTTTTKTETGTARIQKSATQTETGVARIQKSASQTETGTARIKVTTQKTESGVARVTATATKTETAISRIQKSVTQSETGTARILATVSRTATGTARVEKSATQTETGVANIVRTSVQTMTGVALIVNTTQQSIQGTANIVVSNARYGKYPPVLTTKLSRVATLKTSQTKRTVL